MSVKDRVLELLKSKEWIGSDEIEAAFPAGSPGHFSWPQRLRSLREPCNGGFTIEHRIKEGTKNLSEWHLVGKRERQAFEDNQGQLAFLKADRA